MSLHEDLIGTARYLLRRPHDRLTQADLRRCVSTAYYALFHFLADEGVKRLTSSSPHQDILARAFAHTEMRKSCHLYLKTPLPPSAVPLLGPAIPHELKEIATAFIDLQDLRHDADYNRGRVYEIGEARDAVDSAAEAVRKWDDVRDTRDAQVFLSLLLLGDRWNR